MFSHLLVPTDGSPLSRYTVTRAIAYAREAGARITFFCAVESFPTMYHGVGAIFDGHALARFQEEGRSVAEDILGHATEEARAAGVECAGITLSSTEPYDAIIRAAEREGCDLIFMASHGRKGVGALLLGSETVKVLTHSKIPVLVYR